MPCNSDYMEQNDKEHRLQQAAQILLFLEETGNYVLGRHRHLELKKKGAKYYAEDVGQIEELCQATKDFREMGVLDNLLRDNFKNPIARSYADWIVEHDENDRRREEQEIRMERFNLLEQAAGLLEDLSDEDLKEIIKSGNILTAFQPRA